jgi:hypothetical protein
MKACKHGRPALQGITMKEAHCMALMDDDAKENVACLGCLLEDAAIKIHKLTEELRLARGE